MRARAHRFRDALATTATDTSGRYALSGVPAGAWTVEFVPDDGCLGRTTGFAFQFYRDAGTPASATPVTVTAGQTTTGIDANLPAGATVAGSVTDTSGFALAGVCVILEDTAGRAVLRQPTDTQGINMLAQLPPGRFIVQLVDDDCAGEPAHYAPAYYPDAATPAAAQVIAVGAGTITGPLDATLLALPPSTRAGAGTGHGHGLASDGGRRRRRRRGHAAQRSAACSRRAARGGRRPRVGDHPTASRPVRTAVDRDPATERDAADDVGHPGALGVV